MFKLLALVVSEILKNHFMTADAAAEADMDDSIKRKGIRVSRKKKPCHSSLRPLHVTELLLLF